MNHFQRASLTLLAGLSLLLSGFYASTRWLSSNFGTVIEGKVYRSAQPRVDQLEQWVGELDLRTVINLRSNRGYESEAATARGLGIEYAHLPITDGHLPKRLDVLRIIETLESSELPMLIHCRACADRTGVLSVLAAMAVGGQTYRVARSHLNLRHLHLDSRNDAVEGLLFKYENFCRRRQLDTGGWAQFRTWIVEHYSPSYYLIHIEAPARLEVCAGEPMDVELEIHNQTDVDIPALDPDKTFNVACYLGSAVDYVPDREFGPRARLDQVIPAEGSVTVIARFWPSVPPGTYPLRFDLVEEHVTWFAHEGSPEPTYELIVRSPTQVAPTK
jgi:protein tyrosine phosphatase (PTP) superfamily phosphohydrolase (DUF442 family)